MIINNNSENIIMKTMIFIVMIVIITMILILIIILVLIVMIIIVKNNNDYDKNNDDNSNINNNKYDYDFDYNGTMQSYRYKTGLEGSYGLRFSIPPLLLLRVLLLLQRFTTKETRICRAIFLRIM